MDKSKCDGDGCPLKHTCIRYTSKPDENYQIYFMDAPYDPVEEACQYYLESETYGKD